MYNNSYQASIKMAPFEALYGRKCHSPICWDDIRDRGQLGPEILRETTEKVALIRTHIKASQDRQKSYADSHRRPLHFAVDDLVFLKVSPMTNVMRFGNKGKLSPRYVGPYRILAKVGDVAYKLELPTALSQIHDVFHVSSLRKYMADPSHILEAEPLRITPRLMYEEHLVAILDRETQHLRTRSIDTVLVLWCNHDDTEATWELEDSMRQKYLHLFQ